MDSNNAISQVPHDFPFPLPTPGSIGGVQAKVQLVEYEGVLYSPGTTPLDRFARWDICEDLAQQFKVKCLETKAGKRAHMSESEILQQYYDRLSSTGWTSQPEAKWIMLRVAALLAWPARIEFNEET
ncbi:hypothetical protein [Undibacterium terreum]|uniref:Uncharacterized protein n=1 Tax=Undibacterium terreum TaxID=1224302 RepID=A0A916UKW3_9BURK|nr:hypothetical protein [Undibacterium terreum]GGC75421.1 hypothetical protein GCM10011396_23340 [Undibacterium terreum]